MNKVKEKCPKRDLKYTIEPAFYTGLMYVSYGDYRGLSGSWRWLTPRKNLSDVNSSTLGNERMGNWAFKEQSKKEFMNTILDGQPFNPHYFDFDVDTNKEGAENIISAIKNTPFAENSTVEGLIVDMRNEAIFKKGHLKGSINVQAVSENAKFETWLGYIITPKDTFTLIIDRKGNKDNLLHRVANIGYEKLLEKVILLSDKNLFQTEKLDLADCKKNPDNYTIVNIRNSSEVEEGKFFDSVSHPLNELRETAIKFRRTSLSWCIVPAGIVV